MSTEIESGRWIVTTGCHDCLIAIEGEGREYGPWVSIYLFSNHGTQWAMRWRSRLRQAWEVLRGRGVDWLIFDTEEQFDDFVATLARAKARAFPSGG